MTVGREGGVERDLFTGICLTVAPWAAKGSAFHGEVGKEDYGTPPSPSVVEQGYENEMVSPLRF